MFERRGQGKWSWSMGPGARGSERGAGLPLLAIGLVALLLTTSVLIGLSARVLDRSQAQAAADAAALAGLVDGRSGATRLAAANGARLLTFESGTNAVRVVVEVDGRRAEARAERSLGAAPRSASPSLRLLE